LQRQAEESAHVKTPITLPNIENRPGEKAADKQAEKQPECASRENSPTPVGSGYQTSKKERKPLTFWGYIANPGHASIAGIFFEVRKCSIKPTLVSCIMNLTSIDYDREFFLDGVRTTITDNDGDIYRININVFGGLQLDRNSPVPLKLEFPVNKDVARPIVVRLNGYFLPAGRLRDASFRIGD
jgi:hypothetical protein